MRTGDKTIDESRQGEALVVDGKGSGKKLFLESYGCAMNFSDSEIIASILAEDGYSTTREEKEAELQEQMMQQLQGQQADADLDQIEQSIAEQDGVAPV